MFSLDVKKGPLKERSCSINQSTKAWCQIPIWTSSFGPLVSVPRPLFSKMVLEMYLGASLN